MFVGEDLKAYQMRKAISNYYLSVQYLDSKNGLGKGSYKVGGIKKTPIARRVNLGRKTS